MPRDEASVPGRARFRRDIGARTGKLAIMAGGDRDAYESVLPLFQIMGETIALMGGPGKGQHTKMANQILIASTMIGTVESLLYAVQSGLGPDAVIDIIGKGAAASWSLNNLGRRIAAGNFDPGFFIRHFVKDMGIALEEARRMNLPLPVLLSRTSCTFPPRPWDTETRDAGIVQGAGKDERMAGSPESIRVPAFVIPAFFRRESLKSMTPNRKQDLQRYNHLPPGVPHHPVRMLRFLHPDPAVHADPHHVERPLFQHAREPALPLADRERAGRIVPDEADRRERTHLVIEIVPSSSYRTNAPSAPGYTRNSTGSAASLPCTGETAPGEEPPRPARTGA